MNQELIEKKFKEIMKDGLGLDLNDPSLKNTPKRIAKMYCKEIFSGLIEETKPKMTTFPNDYKYDQIIGMYNQTIWSTCEHHFAPFKCKISIGYIPNKLIIGASKLVRISKYYAKRPQVQERLAKNIADELENTLKPKGLIVYITEGMHTCVQMRGVENSTSEFVTSDIRGIFKKQPELENKFINMIK